MFIGKKLSCMPSSTGNHGRRKRPYSRVQGQKLNFSPSATNFWKVLGLFFSLLTTEALEHISYGIRKVICKLELHNMRNRPNFVCREWYKHALRYKYREWTNDFWQKMMDLLYSNVLTSSDQKKNWLEYNFGPCHGGPPKLESERSKTKRID